MKYLPFENITYTTALSPEQVMEKITQFVEPEKRFRLSRGNSTKPYEGKVSTNAFKVTRKINYRNSFLPRISGTVEEVANETKVTLKMRLHPFVLVFISLWMSFVFLAVIVTFPILISEPELPLLIPLGMLTFGYLLTTGGFKYESRKSKAFFKELLEINEKPHIKNK